MSTERLLEKRRLLWRQVPDGNVPDPEAARAFIDQVGVCTLYPASSEFPNLFHAHAGDPDAKTSSSWDSPSGRVYCWRWALGKAQAAFYGSVVARKPTWVSWEALPCLLGALMERRDLEAVYRAGELSLEARRVAQAYADGETVLSTKELRARAGFPTGKENRAAYLRAVDELESRLLLAKAFPAEEGEDDMAHAWVPAAYPEAVAKARAMKPDDAFAELLGRVLPWAVFLDPKVVARHLRVDLARVHAAGETLAQNGKATLENGRIVSL